MYRTSNDYFSMIIVHEYKIISNSDLHKSIALYFPAIAQGS